MNIALPEGDGALRYVGENHLRSISQAGNQSEIDRRRAKAELERRQVETSTEHSL